MVVYCGRCGIRLRGADFDQGRAATHRDRCYCADCRSGLSHVDPAPRPDTPRMRRKSTSFREAPQRRRSALLTAAAVAALVALVAALAVPAPSSGSPVGTSPPPTPPAPVPMEPRPVEREERGRLDAAAEARGEELNLAATVLAGEGRFDDAIAQIETFPRTLRSSRAWSSLEALRRQIEVRKAR